MTKEELREAYKDQIPVTVTNKILPYQLPLELGRIDMSPIVGKKLFVHHIELGETCRLKGATVTYRRKLHKLEHFSIPDSTIVLFTTE